MIDAFLISVVMSLVMSCVYDGWTEENSGTVLGALFLFGMTCGVKLIMSALFAGVFAWPWLIAGAISLALLRFLPAAREDK